jgi:hypothetical protein
MLAIDIFSAARAAHRQPRLDDVGDGWRALLLGAPPVLLVSGLVRFAVV